MANTQYYSCLLGSCSPRFVLIHFALAGIQIPEYNKARNMPASVNSGYLKTIEGMLKVLEIGVICVAFSCLAEFDRTHFWHEEYRSRFDFFLAVFAIGWIFVLCVFLTFIFISEWNIITRRNWNISLVVFYIVFVFLFLISSSLIADILRDIYDAKWHKIPGQQRLTNVLTTSVCCGFVSAALFVMDSAILYKKINA